MQKSNLQGALKEGETSKETQSAPKSQSGLGVDLGTCDWLWEEAKRMSQCGVKTVQSYKGHLCLSRWCNEQTAPLTLTGTDSNWSGIHSQKATLVSTHTI